MDYAAISNLPALFFERAKTFRDRPFLWRKQDDDWHSLTWREVADSVTALAHGLRAAGINSGDRVALVSESRPEWLIADLAIMSAGMGMPWGRASATAACIWCLLRRVCMRPLLQEPCQIKT